MLAPSLPVDGDPWAEKGCQGSISAISKEGASMACALQGSRTALAKAPGRMIKHLITMVTARLICRARLCNAFLPSISGQSVRGFEGASPKT